MKKSNPPPEKSPDTQCPEGEINGNKGVKIYFLPSLMTSGNLFCGFLALTKIVEADIASHDFASIIKQALFFIFLACLFDALDGRVARMGGEESPFGREFDSLADLISFGAAPAFLVHRIVLEPVFKDIPEIGWFVASIYLVCGALRLARFNCTAAASAHNQQPPSKEFIGFPIPAAAGLVASLTLFMLWFQDKEFAVGYWRYSLPFIMVFLSYMMVSNVRYPSFKNINLKTRLRSRNSFAWIVVAALSIGGCITLRAFVLPILLPLFFFSYLAYGLVQVFLERKEKRALASTSDSKPAQK
ncbi:MAG: CDP-diacylglycerol--serine O-phosphatidyltransferase [Limisphaerales bacterium]|jgi:CDP-diacylglycerol--serine O-phosphatidyltransferase|nr:CDP-diacylglycerol--serine O-phosphatidyltransferase [Verrucomicrobiota bacterium]